MRLVCLGVDGGAFELVRRWVEKGMLPNFERIMGEGAYGELISVIPPVSPQAWSSFMTGKNPGKHGIYGFRRLKPFSYEIEFNCGRYVRATTLWRLLSDRGKRVIVVNVPMTYPPEEVEGVLVSGMDAPGTGSDYTYPPELKRELDEITGGYIISQHFRGSLTSARRLRKALAEMLELTRTRVEVALELAKRYPADFLMVKFNAVDQSQHYFWSFMEGGGEFSDAIYQAYKVIDDSIPRFEKISEYLMIMSDHGAGGHTGKFFYVNEWLRREGYLVKRRGRKKLALRILEGGVPFLARVLPHRTKDTIRRLFPQLVSGSFSTMKFGRIKWSETRAFLGESLDGLRINLKGVFPEGTVEREGYQELREELASRLVKVKDSETGEVVVGRIYRREELYHGPYISGAPDLIVEPVDYAYTLSRRMPGERTPVVAPAPAWRGIRGVHKREGIVFLKGKGVRRGYETKAHILDLAPTILYMMGEGIPEDYDGRLLEECFEEEVLRANPPTPAPPAGESRREPGEFTDKEAEDIGDRLRGLGYID